MGSQRSGHRQPDFGRLSPGNISPLSPSIPTENTQKSEVAPPPTWSNAMADRRELPTAAFEQADLPMDS